MATGAEWSCPICREASRNIAYVGSCLHQFCRGCIVRWARKNPSCPLCRQAVHTIIYPVPSDQAFMELAVPQSPARRSPRPRDEPGGPGPQPRAHVAGFPAETWALLFRSHAEVLRPLELWLNEVLCGACWWDVAFAHSRIVASLCRYGLREEALVRELLPFLREQTARFVRQLIEVAAERCSELALQSMEPASPANEGLQDSPAAAALEEPRREQPGAEASGAGQSGGCSRGASWQPGQRRGGGPEEAVVALKKACRRQN